MKYSVLIFDFDFTLGDATKGIVESVNYALAKMNLPTFTKEDIRKTVGMTLPNTFTHLTKMQDAEQRALFVTLFKEKADEIMINNTNLFPDTIEVLSYIKSKGMKIGIVTTKYHYRIIEILDKFQISHLVDVIIGGEDVKNAKPHPEALMAAIDKLNVHIDNILYIGDSIIDAQTAQNGNVDFVAVTTGTTDKYDFLQFPFIEIIGGLSEIIPIINEANW